MIFGMAFIDEKLSKIETNRWQIVPKNGHAVAVIEHVKYEDAVYLATSEMKQHDGPIRTTPATCRFAKAKTHPPRVEALVMVCTAHAGTIMVQTVPSMSDMKRLREASEVVKPLPNRQLYIMDPNMLSVSVNLPNNMKTVVLTKIIRR